MLPEADVTLHKGDCLSVLGDLKADEAKLVYADPPFFTQKVHKSRSRDRKREFSFEDLWESRREYAEYVHVRLRALHEVMAPSGAIFFHCDRNATHVARLLLDDVFGEHNFRSEIIWRYRRWSNSKRGLLAAHQTILYYTKSETYTFNPVWEEYSASTNVDQILQRRVRDEGGKTVYQKDEGGRAVVNGHKKGVPLSDVWDIPYLNPKAKERVGYPTQKPLLLLERIIALTTNEGDLVLDPFCGSGTTLVAAKLLGRNAIGIDLSADAIDIASRRLVEPVRTESILMKAGRESYRTVHEPALRFLQGIDYIPVHRNKGIDAILKHSIGGKPVTVRVQRDNETVYEAAQSLYKASRSKDTGIMFLIVMQETKSLLFEEGLPVGVTLIRSPASEMKRYIENLQDAVHNNSELPSR